MLNFYLVYWIILCSNERIISLIFNCTLLKNSKYLDFRFFVFETKGINFFVTFDLMIIFCYKKVSKATKVLAFVYVKDHQSVIFYSIGYLDCLKKLIISKKNTSGIENFFCPTFKRLTFVLWLLLLLHCHLYLK